MISFTSKERTIAPAMVKPINQIGYSANTTENSKALNFLSSFKLNYYFLRAFGLWPFSFVLDSNGKIQKPKITKIDLLWFIISMFLYPSVSIVFYVNSQALIVELIDSKILSYLNHGDSVRIALSLIFVSLSIAIDMFNRFKLVNLLNGFFQFDGAVSVSIII